MANRLQWADAVRETGVVRDGFVDRLDALVHEADVGAVIASALTEGGHAGRTYAPSGPEALSRADNVRTIGEVLGRPVRLEAMSAAEVRAEMLASGIGPDVADFVVGFEESPPAAASAVTSVVEDVTGRPPGPSATGWRSTRDVFGG